MPVCSDHLGQGQGQGQGQVTQPLAVKPVRLLAGRACGGQWWRLGVHLILVQAVWVGSALLALPGACVWAAPPVPPAPLAQPCQAPAASDACAAGLAQRHDPDSALHVLNRLAFGPAPGELDEVMRMGAQSWIDAQLQPSQLPLPADLVADLDGLPRQHANQRQLLQQWGLLAGGARLASDAASDAGSDGGSDGGRESARELRRDWLKSMAQEALKAKIWQASRSPRQLQEVMVDFWFNHFNVFEGKGMDRALVSNYEREAIRPYALGHFRDLLGATAHHPAMLFYLDNWVSSAPASDASPGQGAGRHAAKGLNENYARELMELHTLGVDGGYTQQDVSELARMLTGWSIQPLQADLPPRRERALANMDRAARRLSRPELPQGSMFWFDPARHDGGDKHWLGYHVAGSGQEEGEWALDVLARHPATAHHIAYQLAQYFVADEPPQTLVSVLQRRYLQTDGDIAQVLRALFASPEFWQAGHQAQLFKTPQRYVLSVLRATALPWQDARPLQVGLQQLGMPFYGCLTPDGYANTQGSWLNPDALTRRIELASRLAQGKPLQAPPVDASALLKTWGQSIGATTRATVREAPPALQAALILGSPDAMRH